MKKKWSEVPPVVRKVLLAVTAVDLVLKAAAVRDLMHRPDKDVNGNKLVWRVALTLVNSAGVLPAVYFLAGRRGSR